MIEPVHWADLPVAALGGIALLRLAWGRPDRSLVLVAAGWALLLVGALAGVRLGGAWGLAVATIVAMAAALAVLAVAAATAPATARAAAPNRRAGVAPDGAPLALGRRVVTFLIVVPLALATAIAFAIGVRGAALLVGVGEADANAIALFAVPLAWGLLSVTVLMRHSRAAQLATLLLYALAGAVGFIPGT